MKFVLKNPKTLGHVRVVNKISSCTVCGPWSVTFPNMIKYFVEK